ncbi:putative ubiquitin-conjugating enzyme E2 38 [Papaver somniferum]|uniref:putative ubiquitin-conjugating enzyme E2 38 n=1 Tax=Papaver somniferum TaxID=3469 RepID=UPI000E6FFFF0|nr:putative ubiquitin-conjugating enzyme E2 38 [Papaver somniferum]
MTNHKEQINYQKFNKFDIIPHDHTSIYDHRLARNNQTPFSPETTLSIRKEWKRLEKILPDSIYVRAYEGRIDLLKAVVVGQPGTPYYQGLFFYDIQLTLGYPNSPPNVVSLLTKIKLPKPNDNMIFHRPERSNSKDFSILKILLTIHEHVVSTDSYFNYKLANPSHHNPSKYYLITRWGMWQEKKFLSYDQEMFLLNCKTMLGVLKPYKHFEEFVGQHFRDHAKSILIAAQGYIDDEGRSRVSKYVHDSEDHCIQIVKPTVKDEQEEYRKSMSTTYVELIKASIKNGSPDFLECYYNLQLNDGIQEDGDAKKNTWDPVLIVRGTFYSCLYMFILYSWIFGANGL